MMEIDVGIEGRNLVIKNKERDEVTIKGYIDKIYFLTLEGEQVIFEVKNKNEVWVTFYGNPRYSRLSVLVEKYNENKVVIGGDIITFVGNVENDNEIKKYAIIPSGINIEEGIIVKDDIEEFNRKIKGG